MVPVRSPPIRFPLPEPLGTAAFGIESEEEPPNIARQVGAMLRERECWHGGKKRQTER